MVEQRARVTPSHLPPSAVRTHALPSGSARLAQGMAHDKPIQWSQHLLTYALEYEKRLEAGETQLVRPLRTIPWHPASDVLTAATPKLSLNGQRAAARALRQLEDRARPLATVVRRKRHIASYKLTSTGRTRALELLERREKAIEGEVARPGSEQAKSAAKRLGVATTGGYARLRTHLQEGLLAEDGRYLKPVLDLAPRTTILDPDGQPALTYWDVPLSPSALLAVGDPLDRFVLLSRLLAWTAFNQRDSKANLGALHEAIKVNDTVWPTIRGALIESGELETLTLHPGDIDWIDVPGFWKYPGMRDLPGDTLANPLLRQVLLDRLALSETV